ncbi:MAG: DUF2922 domain-containing protein [Defluviitaleaceae bacterium]|nr:DUF2922 domain-containing protein [Defluviitaleaceae bacterium]
MENINNFRLNFRTDTGQPLTVTIPRAEATNTTPVQLAQAMLDIINTNIVVSGAGEPIHRINAELVVTQRQDFNI